MATNRGQNLVEFALVAVMLLALVIGVVELSRIWMMFQVVTNASREGARVAALPIGFGSADEVTARVDTYLTSADLDLSRASVTVVNEDGPTGTDAVVTVQYAANLLFLGKVVDLLSTGGSSVPGGFTLTARATMRNE